ncbi:MAG: hypothetical protein K2M47_00895 [Clostridiales bacterium]|nr:hypothetical protein [Clostridiales bacterium]MDE6200427.1 hypothetical protein [Clostridiales bacterium]
MAKKTAIAKIQMRNDTADAWKSKNPVLDVGEIGYDVTNKKTKIGDGVTPWVDLDWFAIAEKPTFAGDGWAQIAAYAESGEAADYYKVGDEKVIELSTGETITLVILGFNHDDKAGGGKAGISIGMKNCLSTTYPMNASNTNAGGWDGSAMRTATMATLLSQLPADLQSVIKPVLKKSTAGGASANIVTSTDKLWLLSVIEIMGDISPANGNGYKDEGEQYEYWRTIKDGAGTGTAANPDRIKTAGDGGAACVWWLRSPIVSITTGFHSVITTGKFNSNYAGYSCGVSFGFCV